jgi:hypothetical protein
MTQRTLGNALVDSSSLTSIPCKVRPLETFRPGHPFSIRKPPPYHTRLRKCHKLAFTGLFPISARIHSTWLSASSAVTNLGLPSSVLPFGHWQGLYSAVSNLDRCSRFLSFLLSESNGMPPDGYRSHWMHLVHANQLYSLSDRILLHCKVMYVVDPITLTSIHCPGSSWNLPLLSPIWKPELNPHLVC